MDDIVSSARTMIETARQLAIAGLSRPTCVAVHAVFSEEAYRSLRQLADRIVTTNTIPHETNGIQIAPLLANGILDLLSGWTAEP